MTNISPAARAHTEALAALTTNDEATTALEDQRAELLAAEADAHAAVASGTVTPVVLEALTGNSAKAAAMLPAINSLKAKRSELIRAANRAAGEVWADELRALAPEGTYAALQSISDELANTIREAVSEAHAKADTLTKQAGRLIAEARQLDQGHALPRGASYSPVSGLKLDSKTFAYASTGDLAERTGRALDTEHAARVRAEIRTRTAEQDRARAAEAAAVDAEYTAAMVALSSAPASR